MSNFTNSSECYKGAEVGMFSRLSEKGEKVGSIQSSFSSSSLINPIGQRVSCQYFEWRE